MMSRTNVSDWVANWEELSAVAGDLIEFERILHRHWAVYVGFGQVVHFSPTEDEFNCNSGLVKFVHGQVTYDELKRVAGSSKIRINNKPEIQLKRRLLHRMRERCNILVDKLSYTYNLEVFNCEQFVIYIKFEDWPSSCDQKFWLMTKAHEKVAYNQWNLSAICVARGKPAPKLLIAYINFWEGPNETTEHWQKQYLDILNVCDQWKNLPKYKDVGFDTLKEKAIQDFFLNKLNFLK